MKVTFFLTLAAAITILFTSPVVSQDKPADNMQILIEKIRADRKPLVAANIELTEYEALLFNLLSVRDVVDVGNHDKSTPGDRDSEDFQPSCMMSCES